MKRKIGEMNMSWTDDSEKYRLYEWACKNKGAFDFVRIDKNKDTYYETFDNTNNFALFGFDNMLELDKELQKLWNNQPDCDLIEKICEVAAFKREPLRKEKQKKENQNVIVIPEFVYAF